LLPEIAEEISSAATDFSIKDDSSLIEKIRSV